MLSVMLKKRKRRKEQRGMIRQRRRLIDPELWGSEFLKGVLLESGSSVILPDRRKEENVQPQEPSEHLALKEVVEMEPEHDHIKEQVESHPSSSSPSPSNVV